MNSHFLFHLLSTLFIINTPIFHLLSIRIYEYVYICIYSGRWMSLKKEGRVGEVSPERRPKAIEDAFQVYNVLFVCI